VNSGEESVAVARCWWSWGKKKGNSRKEELGSAL
jgi:hypothetical protein